MSWTLTSRYNSTTTEITVLDISEIAYERGQMDRERKSEKERTFWLNPRDETWWTHHYDTIWVIGSRPAPGVLLDLYGLCPYTVVLHDLAPDMEAVPPN
eukprot:3152782-Amphidinium_carterae.1